MQNEDKLQQMASNFSMHQNHLEGLQKTDCRLAKDRLQAPLSAPPKVSDSVILGRGLRFC